MNLEIKKIIKFRYIVLFLLVVVSFQFLISSKEYDKKYDLKDFVFKKQKTVKTDVLSANNSHTESFAEVGNKTHTD